MPAADAHGPWRIATRRSALAQVQARSIADLLTAATGRPAELVPLATVGDEHPDRAIEAFDAKGLFVDGTRRAVLDGDCHMVVHSYKDLPTEPADGLTVAAAPRRADPRDALVTREGLRLPDLPRDRQVVIGTSSPRRKAQINKTRRDILVQPIRGNIQTRLGKVADGQLDGVVIAVAGLLRLKPEGFDLTAVPLEHGEMLHAPAQGALAVECRTDDDATRAALRAHVDDPRTRTELAAERALLEELEGGCTAPIGAHAELREGPTGEPRIELLGMLSDPSGTNLSRASHDAGAHEARKLGVALATTLLDAGGQAVLERLRAQNGLQGG